jgi:hypothetical protein
LIIQTNWYPGTLYRTRKVSATEVRRKVKTQSQLSDIATTSTSGLHPLLLEFTTKMLSPPIPDGHALYDTRTYTNMHHEGPPTDDPYGDCHPNLLFNPHLGFGQPAPPNPHAGFDPHGGFDP